VCRSRRLKIFASEVFSDFEFLRVPEVRCIYLRAVGAQKKTEAQAIASDGRLFGLGGG